MSAADKTAQSSVSTESVGAELPAYLQPDYAPAGAELRVARASKPAGDGFLLIDKPLGVTSHDVVGTLRRACGTRKIGHAGTLDPAASGVLIIGVGAVTRALNYLVGHDKVYHARIVCGIATDSEDAQGRVIAAPGCDLTQVTQPQLRAVLERFIGPQQQVPSAVSAKKIAGKRAHELQRAGAEVELAAADIEIFALEQLSELRAETQQAAVGEYLPERLPVRERPRRSRASAAPAEADDVAHDAPTVALQPVPVVVFDLRVACSSGTYVRALARDLGHALGTVAHVRSLRRVQSGAFTVASTHTLPEVAAAPAACLIPGGEFARQLWPHLQLRTPAQCAEIRNGKALAYQPEEIQPPTVTTAVDAQSAVDAQCAVANAPQAGVEADLVAVIFEDALLAFAQVRGGKLQPRTVFNISA